MSSPAKPTKILLLSDDFTPMEFVVDVLAGIFKLTKEQAIEAMLNTHRKGRYAVATMERSQAEATVNIVHESARQSGHPFRCILEAE